MGIKIKSLFFIQFLTIIFSFQANSQGTTEENPVTILLRFHQELFHKYSDYWDNFSRYFTIGTDPSNLIAHKILGMGPGPNIFDSPLAILALINSIQETLNKSDHLDQDRKFAAWLATTLIVRISYIQHFKTISYLEEDRVRPGYIAEYKNEFYAVFNSYAQQLSAAIPFLNRDDNYWKIHRLNQKVLSEFAEYDFTVPNVDSPSFNKLGWINSYTVGKSDFTDIYSFLTDKIHHDSPESYYLEKIVQLLDSQDESILYIAVLIFSSNNNSYVNQLMDYKKDIIKKGITKIKIILENKKNPFSIRALAAYTLMKSYGSNNIDKIRKIYKMLKDEPIDQNDPKQVFGKELLLEAYRKALVNEAYEEKLETDNPYSFMTHPCAIEFEKGSIK